jgi:CBS domain-containing protein
MNLAKNLKIDSVWRLHPTPPRQVGADQTVAETVALMRHEKVGCVLVCRADRVVGIFTERDLMKRVLAAGKPLTTLVAECMTANPFVVHRKESIAAAVRHMEEGGYRHLPVVDELGHPVGILSVKRIVHYLVEHFPATVYNLPPDPNSVPKEAEGA